MRVLIFGGTGFLGSAVTRKVRERGHAVVTSSRSARADSRIDARSASEHEIVRVVADARPDVVLNLIGVGLSGDKFSIEEMERVNSIWPRFLARALGQVCTGSLVHVASSTELVRDPSGEFESEYSASKSRGTASTIAAARSIGLPLGVVMLHNTYGPDQPSTRLIQWMISQALAKKQIELDFPHRIRDFVYIDDAAHSLSLVIENAETNNGLHIGTGVGVSLAEAARMIVSACGGSEDLVSPGSDSDDHFRRTVAPGEFTVSPSRVQLTEGIKLTLEARRNGSLS